MLSQRCPACNYDLAGLTLSRGSLCPECGGRVDSEEFRLREESLYRRKVFLFALAGVAPWLGPLVGLIGEFEESLGDPLGAIGAVLAVLGPIAGVFLLYATFRLDVRQEQRARSPWGDVIPSLLLMALYTLCVWVVIGVLAGFVSLPSG